MCGIGGVWGEDVSKHFAQAVQKIRHRGPDNSAIWKSDEDCIFLGHQRLAVIDVSAAGNQPMYNERKGLVISYNGEIYNFKELRRDLEKIGYQFGSKSDTEVLLAAYSHWGAGCLDKLNGMFAFAIWDAKKKELFLARDRSGEKPLYYLQHKGAFYFASELKFFFGIPSLPRNIDRVAFAQYLTYGYVSGHHCILAGYRKLEAGSYIQLKDPTGAILPVSFWDIPKFDQATQMDEVELVEELERLLEQSVSYRLMADVPVGIMLSGGLDSSLITAMASRTGKRVKTYCMSFPDFPQLDESEHAAVVADYFSTDHTNLPANKIDPELLQNLAAQIDEPLADPSILPTYMVSKHIQKHATVVLGGDGGDELFGGYHHYPWLLQCAALRKKVPAPIRSLISSTAKFLPVGLKGRNYLIGLDAAFSNSLAHVNLYFDEKTRKDLLKTDLVLSSPERQRAERVTTGSPLQAATRMDFAEYLCDDILSKVDRCSMLCSLEARAPWLDPALIDFAFTKVPDSYKAKENGEKKILPKLLGKKVLPAKLETNRKQGFSPPLAKWLRQDLSDFVQDHLQTVHDDIFNKTFIHDLYQSLHRGKSNEHRLYTILVFEIWRKENRITYQ